MTAPVRHAVFLDRDGTLITERHYLADPEGVELVEGAVEALKALRAAGFLLVVVTNQGGIAKGLYSIGDYNRVAERLDRMLLDNGVPLDATRFCPHHIDAGLPCSCRKPATGMHTELAESLGIDLSRSWFVGDKLSDTLPAETLGGRAVLVRSGYGSTWADRVPPDVAVVDDLSAAARFILAAEGSVDR